MRGQGRVYRPKVNGTVCQRWWLDYSLDGRRHREPSGTTDRREAIRILRDRVGKREKGELVGRPDRVVFAEYAPGGDGQEHLVGGLRALVEQDYRLKGRRSLQRVQEALDHLEAFLGRGAKAPAITVARINDYAERRIGEGAARATVNYEKAALRRAFRLAVDQGLLATLPRIKTDAVDNPRSGFFDSGELAALLLELPPDVRGLVQFLAATGWRRDEARLLPWAAVDWEGQVIRLEGARSKSGEPRVFPFGPAPALKTLLETRWQDRNGLYVFHRAGQPLGVGAVRSAWKRATKRAGLVGRLVHDLRRTAARDMRRAGLAESDIMELAGWETREMFKRYCIRDEAALAQAVARRFNGKVAAQSVEPVAIAKDVS